MTGAPVQNTDRAGTAVALLIDHFQTKTTFTNLAQTYIAQTQELENEFFNILNGFWVDTAIGTQLDALGEIVGAAREGQVDADYRLRVKARVLVNQASGTVNDLQKIVLALNPGGPNPTYAQVFPGAYTFNFGVIASSVPINTIASMVFEATAAGIYGQIFFALSAVAAQFSFSTLPTTSETDNTKGFAPLNQSTGGHFAGVLSNGN